MTEPSAIWECYRLRGVSKPDEWRQMLERCLEIPDSPYRYDIRNTSLRVWDPAEPEIRVPNSDLTGRNGYEIQRVNFGKSTDDTLVGVTLTRLVFEPGSKLPSVFSADELFTKGRYP